MPYVVRTGYHEELPDGTGLVIGDKETWDSVVSGLGQVVWHDDGTCETVLPDGLPDFDGEYFEHGKVAVAYASLGSGGYVPAISSWEEADGTLSIRYVPNISDSELYTCDMSGFAVIAELPRDSDVSQVELIAECPDEDYTGDEEDGTVRSAVTEEAEEGATELSQAIEERTPEEEGVAEEDPGCGDASPQAGDMGSRLAMSEEDVTGEQDSDGLGMRQDADGAAGVDAPMEGASDSVLIGRPDEIHEISEASRPMASVADESAGSPETASSAEPSLAAGEFVRAGDLADTAGAVRSASPAAKSEPSAPQDPSAEPDAPQPDLSLGGMLSGMAGVGCIATWRRRQ